MINNKLLILAGLLLTIGLFKPVFINNIFNNRSVVSVDEKEFVAPTSDELKAKCDDVIKALSVNNDRSIDGKKLAKLYNDIATLVSLDEKDQVITNTEEIRQANRLAGAMLKLNIKGKYPELSAAAQALVIQAIGDDQVLLSNDLRAKAVEGFKVLAWACNEGSK
jgi:hypothetical protein